ncbi:MULTISPECIES: ABC transporter permease [unclassified Emergencia]|jgi:peptide/nickel transport system permease protein|uniref:ABC transporter permease n=1 Tax=unclassified Emergencia TaxID=2642996 RepID=UPI001379BF64|nr:ABC transporter permease [Emergencia sp. 1XD21-10]NCE98676.1 ABC transporter permease [Emergencia sp. 1XD21-10]
MSEKIVKENAPRKRPSQIAEIWRRFKKSKTGMFGLCVLTIFIVIAICAGLLADETLITQINHQEALEGISGKHIFGTDNLGRDLFARMIYGSRVSLSMGILVVVISFTIGSFIGAATGYFGGTLDNIVMRVFDVLNCLPPMLLIMVIVVSFGTGLVNLLLAMSLGTIPMIARTVRAQVISLTDMEYIQAARAFGSKNFRLIVRHVLPNAMGLIIVEAAGTVATTILAVAGYGYLGFGVQPPDPEWGAILSNAQNYMLDAPNLMLIPGFAIVFSAMSITLIGDGLRDALDPRLKD